jgi:hypothetical protein
LEQGRQHRDTLKQPRKVRDGVSACALGQITPVPEKITAFWTEQSLMTSTEHHCGPSAQIIRPNIAHF